MAITSIMSTRVVSVHMDDSLQSLRELFSATGFHHLVVVHDNTLQGIISDRDLLKASSPFIDTISERARDRALLERKAHQIMTRDVITLSPTDSIYRAIELFNDNKISCLPVVDANRHPVGMVSWRDVMAYMQSRVLSKK
ncbi:CBS domain-containing protein [Alteromonas sp. A079]|uniref:CBS domain-containing protein n=1 Tax=Alteromonas sp. A079 TaxID=3410268 RepID=UPI003BA31DA5